MSHGLLLNNLSNNARLTHSSRTYRVVLNARSDYYQNGSAQVPGYDASHGFAFAYHLIPTFSGAQKILPLITVATDEFGVPNIYWNYPLTVTIYNSNGTSYTQPRPSIYTPETVAIMAVMYG